jgi:hypothetical protein
MYRTKFLGYLYKPRQPVLQRVTWILDSEQTLRCENVAGKVGSRKVIVAQKIFVQNLISLRN